jgi:hypothetical protein
VPRFVSGELEVRGAPPGSELDFQAASDLLSGGPEPTVVGAVLVAAAPRKPDEP